MPRVFFRDPSLMVLVGMFAGLSPWLEFTKPTLNIANTIFIIHQSYILHVPLIYLLSVQSWFPRR